MYRCSAITSLFKSSATAPVLRKSAANGSPFARTECKGKLIIRSMFHEGSRAGQLTFWRRYSLTASQQPTSSAGTPCKLPPEETLELLLPGPVKYIERSTPTITKSELEQYFYPLFCRGWELKRLELETNGNFSDPNHASPFLVRKFRFKGNRSARAFLQETFRIESEEKHHISFKLWSEKRPVITIMTQTHSSRIFDQDPGTNRIATEGIGPGLTLRDIRIAVLLENLVDDPSNLIGRISDPEECYSTDRAAAWQTLLSQYPFTN